MKAVHIVAVLTILSVALVAGCGASSGGGSFDEISARTIYFVKAWSTGDLGYAGGIAVDDSSNLYVCDRGHYRIVKYGPGGRFLRSWGSSGTGNGQFLQPLHVDVGPDGTVSVTDGQRHDVQQFAPGGRFLRKFGTYGTANGQFRFPQGIGANPVSGVLYISDGQLHRMQKFSLTGTFLLKWGTPGGGDGQLATPDGVAVDAAGKVYVANGDPVRIEKFSGGGAFIRNWGTSDEPGDVATDSRGNVWSANTLNHGIQRFKAGGALKEAFHVAPDVGGTVFAEAIAVSSEDFVYVAEGNLNRVEKLARWITYHQ